MLGQNLRPRGTRQLTTPGGLIEELDKDPFSTCMKCGFALSGITKLPKVIDDLSIVLNCGHVLCNKCVHLNEKETLNDGRPQHCRHDFRCSVCGLLSPPLTIPNCVRICKRRYMKEPPPEPCECEVCVPDKAPNYKSRLNNIAYCGIHNDNPVRLFCCQCGKHLCDTCVKQNPNDFKTLDHPISLISKENERLEDALFNGSVIHKNLQKLREDAIQGLASYKERTENVKNTMGCYFIAIINAAIGRYCQLHAAIQCEEEKMQSLVETIYKDTADARRRIEVAREMDELSRNTTLMPEQCTADSYKMSAQKIFKDAVVIHNTVIKNLKSVTTQHLQFYSKKSPHETVKAVAGMFSDFTTANANLSQRYRVEPFTKLLSVSGNTVVEVMEKHMELQENDFSTFPQAQKLPDNSFPRFKSAIEACVMKTDTTTKFHPSLIPMKLEEKANDLNNSKHQPPGLPLRKPTPYIKHPSQIQSNAGNFGSRAAAANLEVVSSSSSPSQQVTVMKINDLVSSSSDPSSPGLPPNDNRAKKQEELLLMIRGASGNDNTGNEAAQKTTENGSETTSTSAPTPPPTKVPWNAKKSSISYEITSYPVSSVPTTSNSILNPAKRTKPNGLPPQAHRMSATATAAGVKNLLATVQGMNISKGLLSVLYTSDEFKELTSPHQYYALRQAVNLTVVDQKRDDSKLSKSEQIYLSGIQHEKLKQIIRKLWESEKQPQNSTFPTSQLRPTILQKPQNGMQMQMPPHLNRSLHSNKMLDPRNLDRRLLPGHRFLNTAGVKSLAQLRSNGNHHSNGSTVTHLPVKTVQIPSDPAMIPPAHRPAFPSRISPPRKAVDNSKVVKEEVIEEEEDTKADIQKAAIVSNQISPQKQPVLLTPKVPMTPQRPKEVTLDELIQKSPPPLDTNDLSHLLNDTETHWISQEELDLHEASKSQQPNPIIQNGPDGRLILRLPRTSLGSQGDPKATTSDIDEPSGSGSTMPTVEECRKNAPPGTANSSDSESVRTIDEDGTHRWCYICNDERRDLLVEEKGICTTCIRVFHKVCSIPKLRVEWSEDDDWQCTFCKTMPPETPKNPNVEELTPRERHLCQLVLMKCFHTRSASKLLTSYADKDSTLDMVSRRLEEDAPDRFTSIEDFIKGVNDVFICSSIHNPKNTEKANCTQKVWNVFRKSVKKHLPQYHELVWLYVSLHGTHGNKRKTLTSCTFGNTESSSTPAKKKRPTPYVELTLI